MKNDRYAKIDLIRGFSIIIVILTHSLVPFLSDKNTFILWDFAHFAVPLFVFCSGYVIFRKYQHFVISREQGATEKSRLSTERDFSSAGWRIRNDMENFFKKRFSRLLIPYYVFLLFYFMIVFLDGKLTPQIIKNGIFLWGNPDINWLVLLFIQLTILVPIVLYFIQERVGLYLLFILSVGTNIFFNLYKFSLDYRFYMWIGWILPLLIALLYEKIENNRRLKIVLLILFCFYFVFQRSVLSSIGESIILQFKKYPPSLYYLSYGLSWLFFLDILFDLPIFKSKFVVSFFEFFSKNSYSLYFIHYLVLQMTYRFFNIPFSWWSLFLYVLGASCILQITLNNTYRHSGKRMK